MFDAEKVFKELSKDYTLPTADIHTDPALFEAQSVNYVMFHLIWDEVAKQKYQDSIGMVENIKKEWDDFACRAKTGAANLIFSAGYDVALHVLDTLLLERDLK